MDTCKVYLKIESIGHGKGCYGGDEIWVSRIIMQKVLSFIYTNIRQIKNTGIKSLHTTVTKSLEIGITRSVHCLYE